MKKDKIKCTMSQLNARALKPLESELLSKASKFWDMGNMTDEAFWHSESRKSRRTGVELSLSEIALERPLGVKVKYNP